MGRPEDYYETERNWYGSVGQAAFNIMFDETQKALKEMDEDLAASKQVGGNHYQLPIQPVDYITKNNLGYLEGNVIKYVTRHKNKNGAEDIRKAIHYLQMILEKEYND